MNSLEYIRTYCNISQSFLAELIGVSRQSIYLWERQRKELPQKRRKQLSELFGLDESFFGEINEETIKELYKKKAYPHLLDGKKYFCFVPHENAVYRIGTFLHDPNCVPSAIEIPTSLNDKLDICKNNIQSLLETIQKLSEQFDSDSTVQSSIGCRNRIYRVFSDLVCTIEQIATKPPEYKMIYWNTLWDTITALNLGFGVIEEDDFDKENDTSDNPWSTSVTWIINTAQIVKNRNEKGCSVLTKK